MYASDESCSRLQPNSARNLIWTLSTWEFPDPGPLQISHGCRATVLAKAAVGARIMLHASGLHGRFPDILASGVHRLLVPAPGASNQILTLWILILERLPVAVSSV